MLFRGAARLARLYLLRQRPAFHDRCQPPAARRVGELDDSTGRPSRLGFGELSAQIDQMKKCIVTGEKSQ